MDLRVSGRFRGSGLAAGLTSFVGRRDELDRLEVLLSRRRLVTVIGAGGSGKTRLALEAARRLAGRFDDGVHVVELAQITRPDLVSVVVAAALGVAEHQGLSMVEAVSIVAGRRHVLLVLDNCEHVIDAAAALCETLLGAGDDLRILATSREALGVPGEARFALGPLPVPASGEEGTPIGDYPSVALFVDRAVQADSAFELTPASENAIADLVRQLDGMPLAIELAAAQLDALSLGDLAAGVQDRFGILVNRNRSVPARQASLAAAVEWSYRLLDASEQRAVRRLSVFPAPFTVEAAEAAVGTGAAVTVMSLVRRSMLAPVGAGLDGRSRYSMLEMVRAYGGDLLRRRGEAEKTARAVAAWTLDESERVSALFDTPDDSLVGLWGDEEQKNVREVLEWFLVNHPCSAVRLAVAVAPWWFLRGHYREGRSVLRRGLDAARDLSAGDLAAGHMWAGRLALYSSDFQGALSHYDQVEDLLRGTPHALLADSLNGRAVALNNLGRDAEASEAAQRALETSQTVRYSSGEAYACAALASMALYSGDFGEALTWAEAAHRVNPDSVNGHTSRWAATVLGEASAYTGDVAGGEVILMETLERCRRAGDRSWAAKQLDTLARIEISTGRLVDSGLHLAEALRVAFDIGDRLRLADCFATAAVWAGTSRADDAAVLWGAYRAVAASWGWRPVRLVDIVDRADLDSAYDSLFLTEPMIRVREMLGARRAAQADESGSLMPVEAAVEFAIRLLSEPPGSRGAQPGPGTRLSRRERELIDLVADGLTDAQIAQKMFISIRTVRSHLDRIRDKTGCRRRAELTRYALANQPAGSRR